MGLGRKVFTRERLTSADVNGYLMGQAVMAFPSVAVRDADLPIGETEAGQVCYIEDLDRHYRVVADGGPWAALAAKHWGDYAGNYASLPAAADGVTVGDTLRHTGLNCLLIYNGGEADAAHKWRQLDVSLVADRTERLTLANATMITILHDGFLVHEIAGNRRYSWDGVGTWIVEGGPHQAPETSIAAGVWTGGANWTLNSATLQEIGQGFAQVTVQVTRNTSTVGVSAIGDVGNTTIATLAAGAAKWLPVAFAGLVSYDGARNAHGYLHTDGRVILTTVAPGAAVIAVGEVIQLSGIYRLADPSAMS